MIFFSVLEDWQNVVIKPSGNSCVGQGLGVLLGGFDWLPQGAAGGASPLSRWVELQVPEWHDMSYGQYSWLITIKNGASHPMVI